MIPRGIDAITHVQLINIWGAHPPEWQYGKDAPWDDNELQDDLPLDRESVVTVRKQKYGSYGSGASTIARFRVLNLGAYPVMVAKVYRDNLNHRCTDFECIAYKRFEMFTLRDDETLRIRIVPDLAEAERMIPRDAEEPRDE